MPSKDRTKKRIAFRNFLKDEDKIASCLQLAMLLETSAYPKPGNVHRTEDFPETKYEHFLASAAALGPVYKWAAGRGIMISREGIEIQNARLGRAIRVGVENMMHWQKGGNTSLGTILLLTPMAISAGLTSAKGAFETKNLRANLRRVLGSSTYIDLRDVYEAISSASPGGLGTSELLDVMSVESLDWIEKHRIKLLEPFKAASGHDSVASEWASGYKITFEVGYPYFGDSIRSGINMNDATVNTFLRILSKVPDTLIARKAGINEARYVSTRAGECLKAGGAATQKGLRLINRMDKDLRTADHRLNPGTTADMLSAVLAIALLQGLRP